MQKITKEIKAGFLADLRASLSPGDTLHCIVRNVAASGMSRSIDVYRFYCVDGKVQKEWLSWRIASVCGNSWDSRRECIRVSGCGMDVNHAVVYNLGRVLWPQGFGLIGMGPEGKKARPATQGIAASLVAAGYSFRGRNCDASGWEDDGGYALRAEQV